MKENQLPVHDTSAEESERVRPAVDSGDGGEHIPRERVTHVMAIPAGNCRADDLSNSVYITMAHFAAASSASAASAVSVVPPALPGPGNQSAAYDPERSTKSKAARDSKLGTWLLASAVISVTSLYAICNPTRVPSFFAQTLKISRQLSADIKTRVSTSLGGTAVTDTAKAGAGTVASAAGTHGAPAGRNSASAIQQKGETFIHGVTRNSVVPGVRSAEPASLKEVDRSAAQQSEPLTDTPMDFTNQGFNQEIAFPVTEMPKSAEAKTSKSKKGFMVPPPPPTPCILPPSFGFFPMQPAQQHAAPQQQQTAARENTPQQPTAASVRTEAAQSAALVDADQELQAALNSSLRTVGEWTR